MKIVLGIPVYNDIVHVDRQIENILNVGYDEVVILDDCSTDGTYDKLVKVTEPYNNIHIVRNNKNSVYDNVGNRWKQVTDICREYSPDWIMIRAMDEIMSAPCFILGENLLRKNLDKYDEEGIGLISFPHVDLWRSEYWYRADGMWGSRSSRHDVVSMWKNTNGWKMPEKSGIHMGLHRPYKFDVPTKEGAVNLMPDLRIVVLHYGMCSHELIAEKLEYQITTSKKIGGRALGVPGGIPHPSRWDAFNGYKMAYEKHIKFKKLNPIWSDKEIPDVPQPEVKSLAPVISKFNPSVAKAYNDFMGFGG